MTTDSQAHAAQLNDPELVVEQIISPETDGQRYPYFHRLRELAPLHQTRHPALNGFHLVSTYEMGKAVLMKTVKNAASLDYQKVGEKGAYYQMIKNWMVHRDTPQDHDRIRACFAPFFTVKAVAQFEPLIERLVEQLLEPVVGRRSMELVSEFAFPLPAMVIAHILGLSDDDVLVLQDKMERYVVISDQGHALDKDSENFRDQLSLDLRDMFRSYLEERRRSPRNDLISAIAGSQADNPDHPDISDAEIIDNFVFALIAGHTTTTDMIGNMLLALHRYPEQKLKLLKDPKRIPAAIVELMRFDSSIAISPRYAYDPVELGGQIHPAGTRFIVMQHGCHHDPAQFDHPDALDLDRSFSSQPFPFGMGRHFCLGSFLARLELEIALKVILKRFPDFHVTDFEWSGTLLTHGPRRLEMAW